MRPFTMLTGGLLLIWTVESLNPPFMYASMGSELSYPVHELMLNETLDDPDGKPDDWHLPDFLLTNHSRHRVVEFYAPWCPHCLHFKDQYVRFARETTSLAKRLGSHVDVYAVSCQMHRPLCQQIEAGSFPWILVYKAGSASGTRVQHHDLHPYGVMDLLGVKLDSLTADEKEQSSKLEEGKPVQPSGIGKQTTRTKAEVYADAFLSFDFAMRQGIYMSPGPLRLMQRHTFKDWMEVLHMGLPQNWNIHYQISAIRGGIDHAVQNETALLSLIDRHRPQHDEWSYACSKGVDGMGYSCGLWELFHIMTVGVVEWNKLANEWQVINTMGVADVIRNYVDNFFGCEVCKRNFVMSYDACAFDRCVRLKRKSGKLADWKELPLWLWETHNAVNVRLMKERAQREGRTTTAQDEIDVQWPSRKDCPRCWLVDGSWNEEFIYQYLRLEYWPDDEKTEETRRYLSTTKSLLQDDDAVEETPQITESEEAPIVTKMDAVDSKDSEMTDVDALLEREDEIGEIIQVPEAPPSPAFALLAVGSIFAAVYVGYTKQAERDRSGRHKKFESDLIV